MMEDPVRDEPVSVLEPTQFHAWPAEPSAVAVIEEPVEIPSDEVALFDDADITLKPVPTRRHRPFQDSVWAVTLGHRPIGAMEILHHAPHVAKIGVLRIHPQWQYTFVLARLIDRIHRHCLNRGYLKLLLEAGAAPALVRRMLEHRGFHLVRRRQLQDQEVFEYYIDLYYDPRTEGTQRQQASAVARDH